ncbi:MAG: methylmalonyl Co-A mutase-associated GTPase MeaB [Desulfitobacteriaceae bacterium]
MTKELLDKFLSGDLLTASRLMTLVENGNPSAWPIMREISQHTGKAYIIGITGPPGAGKSTLTDKLIQLFRKNQFTLGVICVDPSSPFTGGAFLGDRIRMSHAIGDQDVFVRSLANRGELGGLAPRAKEIVQILDAFGKEVIIIETVGAGQVEADIINIADTTVVVTVPGLGDRMQALKAGIMEIADLFVVNKGDREGAQDAVRDLNMMIDWMPAGKWRPKVITTVATQNQGMQEMYEAILEHKDRLKKTEKWQEQRVQRNKNHCFSIMEQAVISYMHKKAEEVTELKQIVESVGGGELDPYSGAEKVIKELFASAEIL